ncbi:uncharacterized protein LOC119068987 [Bradysia coprophila]|uniref:uncharacterized protein LOC119068987 n=1 Tax=Bradysia coprophila TaxID=38358 RepID=UPI00187D7625|nr:uncharacterized protein LOC119068987 [Bradysia coprophila]
MDTLSKITNGIIRSALLETVETKLQSKLHQIDINCVSECGENNFIGIIHRVSFSKEKSTENRFETAENLILKIAPQNVTCRYMFNSRQLFLREIHMYDTVLPQLHRFEISKDVNMECNYFTEYPKFYRSVDDCMSECIFLEDLSVRGFQMIDRYTEDVTAEHVYLVMEYLGKFHAISFAMNDQQPEKFKELTMDLKELYIHCDDQNHRQFCTSSMQIALGVISNESDSELRFKLMKMLERDAIDVAFECVSADFADGAATVISHGDLWQNNTMFRHDVDKKPIEVCFLDWQLSRHSSPIIDVVHYVFCCTTKELRDTHYDEFLKIYHVSLSTHMRKLGSDPDELFPYGVMLEHFKKFGKFGLFISAMLLPMITSEQGNGINLDVLADRFENGSSDNQNIFITDRSRENFNKRMRDVVTDMERLNYI